MEVNVGLLQIARDTLPDKLGQSYLYNPNTGLYCAVGHLLSTAGVPREKYAGCKVGVSELGIFAVEVIFDLYGLRHSATSHLMDINDVEGDDDKRRQRVAEYLDHLIALASREESVQVDEEAEFRDVVIA